MHAIVLAAGSGSRLAAAGIRAPKPFVEIARRPLLLGLIEALDAIGCETITCLTRPDLVEAARALAGSRPVSVLGCSTPSSLHTLALGVAAAPPGPLFCAMVDTVMPLCDWRAAHAAAAADLAAGADAALVVTPFVDDERPVYVAVGSDRRITAVSEAELSPVRVTGGVYGLGPVARTLARALVNRGRGRVRTLLAAMIDEGLCVTAIEVPRVVDVDRPEDIEAANRWLGEPRSAP